MVEVADWMVRNQLKLNKDKSQAIIFHTVKQSPHVPVDTYVNIAGQRVRLATSVRNLGVIRQCTDNGIPSCVSSKDMLLSN